MANESSFSGTAMRSQFPPVTASRCTSSARVTEEAAICASSSVTVGIGTGTEEERSSSACGLSSAAGLGGAGSSSSATADEPSGRYTLHSRFVVAQYAS